MTDSKKTILARRAKFVAAAIAGAGFTSACASSQACLDVVAPDATTDTAIDTLDGGTPDGGADTGPTVCLSTDAPPPDSSTPDGDASDTGPVPCLDVIPDTGADGDGATG